MTGQRRRVNGGPETGPLPPELAHRENEPTIGCCRARMALCCVMAVEGIFFLLEVAYGITRTRSQTRWPEFGLTALNFLFAAINLICLIQIGYALWTETGRSLLVYLIWKPIQILIYIVIIVTQGITLQERVDQAMALLLETKNIEQDRNNNFAENGNKTETEVMSDSEEEFQRTAVSNMLERTYFSTSVILCFYVIVELYFLHVILVCHRWLPDPPKKCNQEDTVSYNSLSDAWSMTATESRHLYSNRSRERAARPAPYLNIPPPPYFPSPQESPDDSHL